MNQLNIEGTGVAGFPLVPRSRALAWLVPRRSQPTSAKKVSAHLECIYGSIDYSSDLTVLPVCDAIAQFKIHLQRIFTIHKSQ